MTINKFLGIGCFVLAVACWIGSIASYPNHVDIIVLGFMSWAFAINGNFLYRVGSGE